MNRIAPLFAAAAIASLAGCASIGSTAAAGQPSASAGTPSAAAVASQAPCTTHACIVTDAESLKGTVAKDNSVMTKVSCKDSTVKQVVTGTYTVHCTVSYSDGTVADGIASVLTGSGNVDWEPTSIISDGS
jgi:hypothetical protein